MRIITNQITYEDVVNVAKTINKELSPEKIVDVLCQYDAEQKNDSTATWNLIVENIIYNII